MPAGERTARALAAAGLAALLACTGGSAAADPAVAEPRFGHETEVVIEGCAADAMEPFIARDGRTLFWNSLNSGGDTRLYYARKITDSRFAFQGEIAGVNGKVPHLDAVASLDNDGAFYFVSLRDYPAVIENLQTGRYRDGRVTGVRPVRGDFYIAEPGWIVMDAEIGLDGDRLCFVNAHFQAGQSLPDQSRLGMAEKSGDGFRRSSRSEALLSRVNNDGFLTYAPCLSADGNELYFTRLRKGTAATEICVSVKEPDAGTFSAPRRLEIPGQAVEAPTLTADGGRLYYHKRTTAGKTYRIYTMERLPPAGHEEGVLRGKAPSGSDR